MVEFTENDDEDFSQELHIAGGCLLDESVGKYSHPAEVFDC